MHPKQWLRFGALALLLLILAALPFSGVLAQESALDQAVTATVRILGCNLTGCNVGLGSGVIIHPSGVILTANHVTLTEVQNLLSPHLEDFVIELTQNARQAPVARYRARLLAAKPESDLALLGIYWDEIAHRSLDETSAIGLPALPIADAGTIALGEQLHILGYPLAGGSAINYTQAALGGFDEDGAMLKANVSLNEGYSGGPALVERNGQYQIAGVVVSRRADVSYIRSVDQLGGMIWQAGARRVWADNVRVTTEGSGAEAVLRIGADIQALDFASQEARLLAYAFDATGRLPWSPAGAVVSGGSGGHSVQALNGQLVLRKDFGVNQPVETGHAVSMEIPWGATRGDPKRLLFRLILWDAEAGQALWRGTEWYAAGTGSPTQMPPSASLRPATPTTAATSTREPTATPAPTATHTSTPPPPHTHTSTSTNTPVIPTATPRPLPLVAPGWVEGRVLWNEQPVAGAEVYVTDEYSFESARYGSATTDAQGRFAISGIPEGRQYLYVFGNRPEFWVSAVTSFEMIAETGTTAEDTYLCKGFLPVSPMSNETINSSRPTLSWNPFPSAVDYAVRVIRTGDNNFIFSRGDDDARIVETSVQVAVDLSPGEYRWRVDAYNGRGHTLAVVTT